MSQVTSHRCLPAECPSHILPCQGTSLQPHLGAQTQNLKGLRHEHRRRRSVRQFSASREFLSGPKIVKDEIIYIVGNGPRILAKALALVASGFVTGSMMSILIRPAMVNQSLAQESTSMHVPSPVMEVAQNVVRPGQSSKARQEDFESVKSRAAPSVKEQVSEIQRLSAEARNAVEQTDFRQALDNYTEITHRFPDLAITNYARINRALLLYQTGNKSEAILELEGLEASLRGYAEVHAALAAIIYSERPSEITYAEEQFDLASEFDKRYANVEWVRREKHWPPAMLAALDKFANLRG